MTHVVQPIVDACGALGYGACMPMTQVSFRLDDETVKRIDAHAKRLAASTPGIEYSRVDAARALIAKALDQAEAEAEDTETSVKGSRKR